MFYCHVPLVNSELPYNIYKATIYSFYKIFKVRKIDDCELIRQPFDLPFNFNGGSCNTFSLPEEKVLMCFNGDNGNGSDDSFNICHL